MVNLSHFFSFMTFSFSNNNGQLSYRMAFNLAFSNFSPLLNPGKILSESTL